MGLRFEDPFGHIDSWWEAILLLIIVIFAWLFLSIYELLKKAKFYYYELREYYIEKRHKSNGRCDKRS